MQLTFRVDQREALRRGINAPSSTIKLDVDPAALTKEQRDILAAIMKDGHDCTGAIHGHMRIDLLELVRPDLQGLLEAIDLLAARLDKQQQDAENERSRRQQSQEATIDKIVTDPPAVRSERLYFTKDGQYTAYPEYVQLSVELPVVPSVYDTSFCSDESIQRLTAKQKAVQQKRDDILAHVQQTVVPELIAEKQAQEAQTEAEWQALYARLPAKLRQRHEAGFADLEEVESAARALLLQDAGYHEELDDDTYSKRRLDSLTDQEYDALLAITSKAPEDACCEPTQLWEKSYRLAEYGDDENDINSDGQVCVQTNERHVVLVSWRGGGGRVKVTAVVPLLSEAASEAVAE